MTDDIQLDLATLREALTLILDELERVHGTTLSVDKDLFWSIPNEQRFDVHSKPTELTIGQVSESFEHLEGLVADPGRVLPYYAVWAAHVLTTAGEELL